MSIFRADQNIAHISSDHRIQSLQDHAEAVAGLCRGFIHKYNEVLAPLGEFLGLVHDLGKAQPEFVHYIRSVALHDQPAPKAPHSGAGALFAFEALKESYPLTATLARYCIDAHHRGLRDHYNMEEAVENEETRRRLSASKAHAAPLLEQIQRWVDTYASKIEQELKATDPEDRQLLIRTAFSALVDADFLDTERFMDEERGKLRQSAGEQYSSVEDLRTRLRSYTERFSREGAINAKRRYFLESCITHGSTCDKGIYSLFLPTGGGKTISSMAWALETAIHQGASRIIYVIPYTSIITQTAQIFREVFGAENVLEHHSDTPLDDTDEERASKAKLLAENWDAPIIVTTNVQFFESLFAHKPSRCRKIHNVARSVLVFDEVQMFPTEFLSPMLRSIESLHYLLETQVLFCSATLPTFDEAIDNEYAESHNFHPLDPDVEPVVPYSPEDFAPFLRVTYQLSPRKYDTEQLAQELASIPTGLCIVNTRSDAARLYEAVCKHREDEEGIIHLSRMMCSAHIQQRLGEVKQRLKDKVPTLVISTQLIEAGVDIDLPIVYRAFAGLDSLIQAAGRCNREGKMAEKGQLISFELTDGQRTVGNMRDAQEATRMLLHRHKGPININDPEVIRTYYRSYYMSTTEFDKQKIADMLWRRGEMKKWNFCFEEADEAFKMIDNKGRVDVFARFSEGKAIIDGILSDRRTLDRKTMRRLQRYKVAISHKDFQELLRRGDIVAFPIDHKSDKVLYLLAEHCYCDKMGVKTSDDRILQV